jgi:transposase
MQRNIVEQRFNRLKQFRGPATRSPKVQHQPSGRERHHPGCEVGGHNADAATKTSRDMTQTRPSPYRHSRHNEPPGRPKRPR